MEFQSFRNQRHADKQKKTEGKDLKGRMIVYERAHGPRSKQHDTNAYDHGSIHHPELVNHTNGRDDAVDREHEVECKDLPDGTAKRSYLYLLYYIPRLAFHLMVDFGGAF